MSYDPLTDRIERLERYNRVLLVGLVLVTVVLVVVVVVLVAGRDSPEGTVEAQAFILRDAEGRGRIALQTLPDGSPGLALYDGAGRVRAMFVVFPDGSPSLYLKDANGEDRVFLSTDADGQPSLSLSDAEGHLRVVVGASQGEDGLPSNGSLLFYDKDGIGRLTILALDKSLAGISVRNPTGRTIWSAP